MISQNDKPLVNKLANDLAIVILMKDRLMYLKEWHRIKTIYGMDILKEVTKKALEVANG